MKKIIILFVFFPLFALAQSQDQNYVKTITPKIATLDINTITDDTNVAIGITYYDGLGRPMQKIEHRQSTSGKDIITPIVYDGYGRESIEYLPYRSNTNDLLFDTNAVTNANQFYSSPSLGTTLNPFFEATTNAFSEKEYDDSPLNRVVNQTAPGNTWAKGNQHTIKTVYDGNSTTDEIHLYKANASWNASLGIYEIGLVNNTDYENNQLYKTITKDENWISGRNNTSEEFKNKEGKIVLKRNYNNEEKHDTYYVYDDYGNLTYVIPPLVTDAALQLDGLCYQYKYDHRNRLVEKKLPGKQWEFMVYDLLDRPILSGPTFSPFGDGTVGWMYTQYDTFDRVAFTGWFPEDVNSNTRANEQNSLGTQVSNATSTSSTIDGISIHYSSTTVPSGLKLLTVNYYDTYYDLTGGIPNNIDGVTVLTTVRGLATSTWVRVLNAITPAQYELTYLFYDKKGRTIQSNKKNYLGGYTKINTALDFVGKPIQIKTYHKQIEADTNPEILTTERFVYNAQDKLVTHFHRINNEQEKIITDNTYDELGQLISKKIGGTTANDALQIADYRYNSRGWLTAINNTSNLVNSTDPIDLFAFKISYDQPENTLNSTIKPLYNGNISETFWTTKNDNIQRKYSYQYDDLNRLSNAIYQKPTNNVSVLNSYNENITYDKNGNIVTLNRNGDRDSDSSTVGPLLIDQLTYTYAEQNQNQLLKVTDGTNSPKGFRDDALGSIDPNDTNDDYKYDANGNMISDDNKHILTIDYNQLNLPTHIAFANNDFIDYFYNAVGQKVKKVVHKYPEVTTTDYLDGYQYVNNDLKFFPHAEGYVNVIKLQYDYVYNYLDHLGNVRLSYGLDPQTLVLKILEENHYYPFGLKHTNYNVDIKEYKEVFEEVQLRQIPTENPVSYKIKYQGQERQDELGLNWDSFKWRNYDYAIGRFMSIDPLTEEYDTWSPYVFSGNRVVDSRELEGLEPRSVHLSFAEAGKNFVSQYNGLSIRMKGEVGTKFYSQTVNGVKQYSYIQPVGSPGAGGVNPSAGPEDIPKDSDYVGSGHTHKEDLNQIQKDENGKMVSNESNTFSEQDLNVTDGQKIETPSVEGAILGTPNGKALMYTPSGNQGDNRKSDVKRLSNQMPSDPNSQTRANNVSPNAVPAVLPYGTSQQDVDNLPKL